MRYQSACGCILGFIGTFSPLLGNLISEPRFSSYLAPMTPQVIRNYAFCVANNFAFGVRDVFAVSSQDPKNALVIWELTSEQLLNDLDFLRKHAQIPSSSGAAAYEVLGTLHDMLKEFLQTSYLSDTLIECARQSLEDLEVQQFERYMVDCYERLSHISPSFEPIECRSFSWDNEETRCDIMLCAGSAEVVVKGNTDGKASVEGNLSYSRQTDSGKKVSAGVSAGVERDKDGKISGKGEARAGVNWDN
jgi:hypothetical protein